MSDFLLPLRSSARASACPKSRNLAWLLRQGLTVPESWLIPAEVARRVASGDEPTRAALVSALAAAGADDVALAVRSCATMEDGAERSFAGQFESVLDVRGTSAFLEAVGTVIASAQSERVQAYAGDAVVPEMAVLVQRMVAPTFSGVVFSRNPLTGLSEIVIEAIEGCGERLVQDGLTPERWVDRWGRWTEAPDDPAMSEDIAKEIASAVRVIERAFGQPADLEWVHDGTSLYWVQLRPMTAAEVPLFSNRISKEVLPGAIKPLVWTINIPMVNGAWIDLIDEAVGETGLAPEDLSRRFHHRAYFDMGTMGRIFEQMGMPRDSLELLLGLEAVGEHRPRFRPSAQTMRLMPRMLIFALDKLRVAGRFRRWLPRARTRYDALRHTDDQDPAQHLSAIDALMALTSETAWFNIVVPLFMNIYSRLLRSRLTAAGLDPDRLDVTHGLAELEEHDPNPHLEGLASRFADLPEATQQALCAAAPDTLLATPEAEGFLAELQEFLRRFGHFSDSGNDLSSVPWRERPDRVVQMIARRHEASFGAASDTRLAFEALQIPLLRRPLLGWLYRRARAFRLHREQVSSLYTYGYGLMRDHVRALGTVLTRQGQLAAVDDVFFLELSELRAAFAERSDRDLTALAAERRADLEATSTLPLPELIFGTEPPPPPPPEDRTVLRGTPTSRGHYVGTARVVGGLDDFDRVQPGDVLVIPFSDVGWTPLFTAAGAVVAESGGMLSHSSIVAREYGIPAVVSVNGACSMPDGAQVAVDGHTGTVTLLDALTEPARPEAPPPDLP